jgi:5-methyltetrahydrofolate--homocysteine methyltransferase
MKFIYLTPKGTLTMSLEEIIQHVIDGEAEEVVESVKAALAQGSPAADILNNGLIEAMNIVGQRFEEGEFYVPEMLVAARAMQGGLAVLKPKLMESGIKATGRIAIGTIKGDLHDIGKNLVAMMLEGAGFEIHDLGTDVAPEQFVEAVRSGDVNLIGMSALLTTTMTNMKDTIKALEEAGLRQQVKVIIGGAPVTESYAEQIGADGYAPDASRAVSLAKTLVA